MYVISSVRSSKVARRRDRVGTWVDGRKTIKIYRMKEQGKQQQKQEQELGPEQEQEQQQQHQQQRLLERRLR